MHCRIIIYLITGNNILQLTDIHYTVLVQLQKKENYNGSPIMYVNRSSRTILRNSHIMFQKKIYLLTFKWHYVSIKLMRSVAFIFFKEYNFFNLYRIDSLFFFIFIFSVNIRLLKITFFASFQLVSHHFYEKFRQKKFSRSNIQLSYITLILVVC